MSFSPDFENNITPHRNPGKGLSLLVFPKEITKYVFMRSRQLVIFSLAGLKLVWDAGSGLKTMLVSRMFWGRGSFYRTAFHLFVFTVTVAITLSGISSHLNIMAEDNGALALNENIIGRQDLFNQSGSVEALTALSQDDSDFEIDKYVVVKNDTLSSIAKLFNKNVSTLVWSNNLVSSDQTLTVGQVLRIPAIDGAFYKVKKGDTLAKIAQTTKGNVDEILGLNSDIDPANPVLTVDQEIFIPNGSIPAPVAAAPKKTTPSGPKITGAGGNIINIPNGMFVNPLKDCGGYQISSGFGYRKIFGRVSFHEGIDMAKAGGCWEEAAGNGKVIKAGWGGWGYTTIIDHGNGITTIYGHGNGNYAVKQGDTVKAGQRIMYMGCSGVCTGTHLHFQLDVNNKPVDPRQFVSL